MSENEEQPVEENAEAQAEATPEQTAESAIDQEVIQAIPINLTIEVGSTTLKLRDLLKLSQGSLLELCLLYTSPSPRDGLLSRMPSSA